MRSNHLHYVSVDFFGLRSTGLDGESNSLQGMVSFIQHTDTCCQDQGDGDVQPHQPDPLCPRLLPYVYPKGSIKTREVLWHHREANGIPHPKSKAKAKKTKQSAENDRTSKAVVEVAGKRSKPIPTPPAKEKKTKTAQKD